LRQFPLHADSPNSLTELFGNIMAHLRSSCLFWIAAGCRIYATLVLDGSARPGT
jgi:hypothetical protein